MSVIVVFLRPLGLRLVDTKGTSAFSGGAAVNTKRDIWNIGLGIPIQTGANFTLGWNNNKLDTNNQFSTYNPVYASSLKSDRSHVVL